jgi:hypothetical protein
MFTLLKTQTAPPPNATLVVRYVAVGPPFGIVVVVIYVSVVGDPVGFPNVLPDPVALASAPDAVEAGVAPIRLVYINVNVGPPLGNVLAL